MQRLDPFVHRANLARWQTCRRVIRWHRNIFIDAGVANVISLASNPDLSASPLFLNK
jgi:hypothetical protein